MKWKRRMKVVLVSQKMRKREGLVAIVVAGEEGQLGVVEGFLHLPVKQRGVVLIWLMQRGTIAAIRCVSFTPKLLLWWLQGWGRGFASNVAGLFNQHSFIFTIFSWDKTCIVYIILPYMVALILLSSYLSLVHELLKITIIYFLYQRNHYH